VRVAFDTYGPTSGNDEREARSLMDRLLVFSLPDAARGLRAEAEFREGDRNSVTLAKEVDFRILMSVLKDGAIIHENNGDARASVQLLDGNAALDVDGDEANLTAGQLATIDVGHRWQLTSRGESTVLLTIAWPREKAGV
jgi:mannose-6-phosphate isomerase-like protein (cupin superfamily)